MQQDIESIQNCSLHFVLNAPPGTSGTEMRERLSVVSLAQRRYCTRLAMVHRSRVKESPDEMKSWFTTNGDVSKRSTRDASQSHLIQPKSNILRNSF
jgi:hypothetical protein